MSTALPRFRHLLASVSFALGLSLLAPTASAAVVERVVAIVGEKAILASDLRARAKPFIIRIYQQMPAGAQRDVAVSQIKAEVLNQMIDEHLEQRAANRARIVVTSREVDAAIDRIARQNNITVEDLVAEAVRSGMSEQEYRREIRRQVLDAKLMNLRLQGRIRVTEDDTRAEYRSIVMNERRQLPFRVAWITLPLPAKAKASDIAKVREKGERLSRKARQGEDFAALARKHSSDAESRDMGGLLPRKTPGELPKALDRVILAMEVGEVSSPIRLGDHLVVVTLIERAESELPSYEEAKLELQNRVYLKKMDKARRRWLDQLRRRTHVEIRF